MAQRFNRERWLDFALQQLAASGPEAMTLDALCVAAERTKGSFYHHFADHPRFIAALAEHWREQALDAPIAAAHAAGDTNAVAKLAALNEAAARLDPRLEIQMRWLAGRYSRVAETVAHVDAERFGFLLALYRSLGLRGKAATNAAQLQLSGYVGAQFLWPATFDSVSQRLGQYADRLITAEHQRDPTS